MRRLTTKQVRYLWAIGLFKSGGKKATSQQIENALSGKQTNKVKSELEAKSKPSTDSKIQPKVKTEPKVKDTSSPPPKEFKDIDEADAWATKNLSHHGSAKTTDHLQAQKDYIMNGLPDEFNGFLRGDQPSTPQYESQKRLLDESFDHAKPTKHAMTVHRGISGDFAEKLSDMFANEELIPGTIISDKAYTSTSLLSSVATSVLGKKDTPSRRMKMEIEVPKGSKVLYFDQHDLGDGDKTGDAEVLLPRGSKFEYLGGEEPTSFDGHYITRWRLHH